MAHGENIFGLYYDCEGGTLLAPQTPPTPPRTAMIPSTPLAPLAPKRTRRTHAVLFSVEYDSVEDISSQDNCVEKVIEDPIVD